MPTTPKDTTEHQYGFRITLKRDGTSYIVSQNGAEIGTYSDWKTADCVAYGIRTACSAIRAADLKSDWWHD